MNLYIKRYISIIIVLLVTAVSIILIFYSNRPIKIGYSSGTTGSISEVGVDGRNSFLLKIKEVNDAGGINGRKIETFVVDDQNDPKMVPIVHDQLEEQGVSFVVGHILSILDKAVLDEAKEDKLILSSSMSSALMDGIDDNFIRLASSYAGQVDHLNQSIVEDGVESLTVIYDLRNKAYAEGFYQMMAQMYPGEIMTVYTIGSEDSLSVDEITDQVAENPSDGLLLITPAVETAKVAQMLDKKGVSMTKYGVSWSMTNDLFIEGGKAVDGMKFIYVAYSDEYSEYYEGFKNRFISAYGYEPSTICFNTYEMTSILIEVLEAERSTDVQVIKEAIVGHEFEGLTDDIIIDSYGDRQQIFMMYEAKNEMFISIND